MSELSELIPRDDIPDDESGLLAYLGQLIEHAGRVAAFQVNATLTMRNWLIGRAISNNVLRHTRADYGKEIVATLGQQLTRRFGRGFDVPNVTRMTRFARLHPDHETVVSLAQQLSWTHIVALLPLSGERPRSQRRMRAAGVARLAWFLLVR